MKRDRTKSGARDYSAARQDTWSDISQRDEAIRREAFAGATLEQTAYKWGVSLRHVERLVMA